MYSHEELISAVRAAGRDGKTFTVKDVRTQLGFVGRDKKEVSRFRRRLRAFEKTAGDQLEKLGNNSYRLRAGAFEDKRAQTDQTQQFEAIRELTEQELQLEPASGVFETTLPANQAEESPAIQAALPPSAAVSPGAYQAHQAYQAPQPPQPLEPSISAPRRVLSVASALVSGALSATAAVSGSVREHGRNLRAELWSCLRSAPARRHAFARLRGWAEGLRPLSIEVREQLNALRQRVSASRRRAA